MRNIMCLLAVMFMGCSNSGLEDITSETDSGSVLEVVTGDLSDMTVMGGMSDAELIRFDVINRSDRDVVLHSQTTNVTHEDYTSAEVGSFMDVKFVNSSDTRTLMGPKDLRPEVGSNIDFNDEITFLAGETTTLVLRADIGTVGERYLVLVGSLTALIENAAYADTRATVPADQIRNNNVLGRVVTVLPVAMAAVPETTTALVATFRSEMGFVSTNATDWQLLGTVGLDAYGGDAIFNGLQVFGANMSLAQELTFARDGVIVGEISSPISACNCGSIRMAAPLMVHDGQRIDLEIWGRIPAVFYGPTVLTLNLQSDSVSAEAVDGGAFTAITSFITESRFHVWDTYPMIVRQALPTTIVNGIEQDLIKLQVSSAVTGSSFRIGSLTFRAGVVGGGFVSGLGIRVGSTALPRSRYRIVRTTTGEELGPTSAVSRDGDSEQITVVFLDPDGLEIIGSGDVITLTGTPSSFSSGDVLSVHFGDRIFSSGSFGVSGNMTVNGLITTYSGTSIPGEAVDPIIWKVSGSVGGIYTGAWGISDLEGASVLTMR